MRPPELDMTQEELANLIRSKSVVYATKSNYIPRLTKSSFIYFKGKHAGKWRDQEEERKVRQYV
ncbi:hypothetical protein, partial [Helicobacter suis]|uniref:hypothetical protein n=1 Tax=Helicobacter suis TaxID=104628 RepID=UPI001966FF95